MSANKHILRSFIKAMHTCARDGHYKRALPLSSKLMSTYGSKSQFGMDNTKFQDVLPGILDALVSNPRLSQVPEVGHRVKKVLEYTLAGGKKTRGLTTVFAFEMLEKQENITEESLRLARILGWCVEMLHAYVLMIDDMMDGSSTRRSVTCWYRLPDVGLEAMNDAALAYCALYETLKKNFEFSPYYTHLIDYFQKYLLYTCMGQHLDMTMAQGGYTDYRQFTIERYNLITKYKTAYYSYNMPISLGLLLANKMDRKTHDDVGEICVELGRLFQIQDDYIDCFGDERISGKAGTDIQEGKCSWLAVSALKHSNEAQRALFVECYASKDPEHVARIKQLYEELNIPDIYKQETNSIYQGIVKIVNSLSSDTSPALFLRLLPVLYNRRQ